MKKVLFLIIVSLMLAGVASANTVWNPASNGVYPPDVANWNDVPTHWTNGTPVSAGDGTFGNDAKAVFAVVDPAECQITDAAVCGAFVMGEGPAGPHNAVLRIMDGGSLTMVGRDSWSAIGYNRDAGVMIVEYGGSADFDSHLYIGQNGDPLEVDELGEGRLIINGGTVIVADTFRYGREANCRGYVDLNAGYFQARYTSSTLPYGDSLIDIKFGKFLLTGGENTDRDNIQAWIDNGFMVAWGGAGTVLLLQEANNDWYAVADPCDDPLARTPTMDALQYGSATTGLSWLNLPPNSGSDVWVDVYFGTDAYQDPNGIYADFTKVVDAGLNAVSATVATVTVGQETYLWRVDTYLDGDPAIPGLYEDLPDDGDPNTSEDALYSVDEGLLMVFDVTDDFPPSVVIDTLSTVTWKNVPIQLDATIIDDAGSPVNILWTSDDPNAVFSPSDIVEDPTVAVNYATNAFDVTITVTDDAGGDAATLGLQCRQDACDAARYLGGDTQNPADVLVDCEHDLADFAVIAADWLDDYALKSPAEIPQS